MEYALARTTSLTLVAEYQTMLPSKAVLRAKLHELYVELAPAGDVPQPATRSLHAKPTKRPRPKVKRKRA